MFTEETLAKLRDDIDALIVIAVALALFFLFNVVFWNYFRRKNAKRRAKKSEEELFRLVEELEREHPLEDGEP